ncbi:hypothetical protein BD560DRAFT_421330 [Blakeslea trispora]|nr:hypothetical protein BD560DRAFT_421330 [Blakeslea trispora]
MEGLRLSWRRGRHASVSSQGLQDPSFEVNLVTPTKSLLFVLKMPLCVFKYSYTIVVLCSSLSVGEEAGMPVSLHKVYRILLLKSILRNIVGLKHLRKKTDLLGTDRSINLGNLIYMHFLQFYLTRYFKIYYYWYYKSGAFPLSKAVSYHPILRQAVMFKNLGILFGSPLVNGAVYQKSTMEGQIIHPSLSSAKIASLCLSSHLLHANSLHIMSCVEGYSSSRQIPQPENVLLLSMLAEKEHAKVAGNTVVQEGSIEKNLTNIDFNFYFMLNRIRTPLYSGVAKKKQDKNSISCKIQISSSLT